MTMIHIDPLPGLGWSQHGAAPSCGPFQRKEMCSDAQSSEGFKPAKKHKRTDDAKGGGPTPDLSTERHIGLHRVSHFLRKCLPKNWRDNEHVFLHSSIYFHIFIDWRKWAAVWDSCFGWLGGLVRFEKQYRWRWKTGNLCIHTCMYFLHIVTYLCIHLNPRQYFHYRMLGLGPHYKASKTYDFIVPCDVERGQFVAIEFYKPVRG